MSWASKRKTIYFLFFVAVFLLIASFVYYFFFYKAPTCFDGVKNQNEQDIDCGGICAKVCDFQAIDPIILWSKFFKVKEGIYNLFALVENPNLKKEAFDVPYSFKLYDKNNVLISETTGKIDIPSRGLVPIFERTILTNKRIPVRSPLFQFIAKPIWKKVVKERLNLSVGDKVLFEKDGNTRLRATIKNNTVQTVKNIEVTGIITNAEGNAIAVSQTIIDSLPKNSSDQIVFTWPGLFADKSNQIKVIVLKKNTNM